MIRRRAIPNDAIVTWAAAFLVVVAGYAFVFRNGEVRIEERRADNLRTIARLQAGERELAERPQLEAEQHRLTASMRNVDLGADTTRLVSRFMRDAAGAAARHRVAIVAIAASGPAAAPLSPAPLPSVPQAAVALDCTVEGRYADVLAALRDVSATRVPASVDLTSLARRNANADDATVSAVFHVVLQRLAPARLTDDRAQRV
jgi:hypothetical protein